METKEMLKKLHSNINSHALMEHEKDYVERLHKKIIYSGRPPEANDVRTIKKLYQLFLKRSMK
ncbi:MAG: hypothetical protein ACQETE_07920 [Bacteroidota bacterium]|jgi:hypothetical protein